MLGIRPLVFVGEASYCPYMLHFNLWNMIHDSHLLNRSGLAQYDPWISNVLLIALALVAHHFLEKPARLDARLAMRLRMRNREFVTMLQSRFSDLVVDAFPVIRGVNVFEPVGVALDEGVGIFIPKGAMGVVRDVRDDAVAELIVLKLLARRSMLSQCW